MEKKSILDPMPFTVDSFFTTQEQRDEEKKEKVEEISIDLLDEFPNHPFKVLKNEELSKLEESIKDNGVLEPIIVRKKDDRYEIVSGHRRKLASTLVGLTSIPCIVRDMNDDEATIYMVDSNMHRETILPSEKAKAYKMKLDALSHQGQRNDLTSARVGHKSRDMIAEENGESREQVRRYIRLNELIPELLDMVDNKEIAFNPAVELSYLKKKEQEVLLDTMNYCDATPSHAQAIILKKLSQNGELNDEKIVDLMEQEKPNQISKIKIREDKIQSVIPKNLRIDNYEDFVVKACEYYGRHLIKNREQER
ncbi:MAG: ParB/RepB/Spo0J family partition protein [Bacilli bacterium]|nr:ParB/RepB/Spo0J family partition protein [Bacilli bacterium]